MGALACNLYLLVNFQINLNARDMVRWKMKISYYWMLLFCVAFSYKFCHDRTTSSN